MMEGGLAALTVLELLPGFWSCSKGFGVKCEHLFDLLWKGVKTKIEKNRFCFPFCTVFLKIFAGENSQIEVQVACIDHTVLISKTDDICFGLYIKDY